MPDNPTIPVAKSPDQVVSELYHKIEAERNINVALAEDKLRASYSAALRVIEACARGPHQVNLGTGVSFCKDGCSTCAAQKFMRGFDE